MCLQFMPSPFLQLRWFQFVAAPTSLLSRSWWRPTSERSLIDRLDFLQVSSSSMAYAEFKFPHITSIASPVSSDLHIFDSTMIAPAIYVSPVHDMIITMWTFRTFRSFQPLMKYWLSTALLEYRRKIKRVSTWISDSERIAKYLAGLQDSSNEL